MSETLQLNARARASAAEESRSSVIARTAVIMDAFSTGQPRWLLNELTEYTGLPRSTVFRLITQLVEVGWLTRDEDLQGYRLGGRIVALEERGTTNAQLRETAKPVLRELRDATGLCVQLAVLEPSGMTYYLDRVGALPGALARPSIGFRFPVENTSAGKAILAMMRPGAASDVVAKRERDSHVDLAWVRTELTAIRRNYGLASHVGGAGHRGVSSMGAAIIGPDGPIGALAISGVGALAPRCMSLVSGAAQRVSAELHPEWFAQRRRKSQANRQAA
ncbi:DNA-binding IclR family transcriptional regulator [Leucobacter exalbidus]|uniref:DNA-binding IclR family transcriptional regulator n=1 Tax=Leucobacter exalbidus TaxID=662960 RepID=A0A940PTM5_9MICO|nr:helix-turn-helix domain-containing protein [Leucobacter exalbidus]MBP1326000.1 DNA-binding IclR family transcriptional regulator [Leucobacter exalbidus]